MPNKQRKSRHMSRLRLVAFLMLSPVLLCADADRLDWVGDYAMNHDGHPGTLRIVASKKGCKTLPCPYLAVRYIDEHGSSFPAFVNAIDDRGQHMQFTVAFPANPQVFDVYIFSFDKTKLAGTTLWQGRTFGVYAEKRAVVAPPGPAIEVDGKVRSPKTEVLSPDRVSRNAAVVSGAGKIPGSAQVPSGTPTKVLTADGTVELHYPDGTVRSKKIGGCGWNTRYPDGRFVPAQCVRMSAMPVVPPPPPAGSDEDRWLQAEDRSLLDVLQQILGGAQSPDFQNYLQAYENPAEPSIYKRIYFRTNAISELAYTPK
jgi:hypothetical protein